MLTTRIAWEPPALVSRPEIVSASDEILGLPDRKVREREDLFRIQSLGMDWDIGGQVFEPDDVPRGADGKRIGLFILHGGAGDHRGKASMARLIAGKLGYKVATMTYPGKLYLDDESREWPGDTINPDGTARTPIWKAGEHITPDQYELVEDRSDPQKRAKWGTLFFLRARDGTLFYDRMAAWPKAFEDAMIAVCRRHFPADDYSVYLHGHSTGGPFVHMLLQRVDNVAGLVGAETSPWGAIYSQMLGMRWDFPFTYLTLRTWRHIAKYAGVEAGEAGVWKLPWIMEDVLEAWDTSKKDPQFKAEYLVTYGVEDQLAEAARAAARRLAMNAEETDALVVHFQGYAREVSGPGVRPVPPLLYGIARGSRDHTPERYQQIVLPAIAAMRPSPKARLVQFDAGVHGYAKAEDGLPKGILPAIMKVWNEAITGGYYVS
jgi:hypothetical protein